MQCDSQTHKATPGRELCVMSIGFTHHKNQPETGLPKSVCFPWYFDTVINRLYAPPLYAG